MIRRSLAGRIRLVALAAILILAAPGEAAAVAWSAPAKLTTSRNGHVDGGLVVAGSTIAVAYEEARGGILRVWFKRSTDAAATWASPIRLSRETAGYAMGGALAGAGSKLSATWTERMDDGAWVVFHSASTDTGATWSTPKAVSSTTGDAGRSRVARDSAGNVAVVWTDNTTGSVRIRRSTDGGATWLSAVGLATTTNDPFEGVVEAFPDVAFGSSGWVVAYFSSPGTVKIRRSTNLGGSWGTASTLTSSASAYGLDLDAAGANMIVGYARRTSTDIYAAQRRTTDSGATWAAEAALALASGPYSFVPAVDISGSGWRATWEQCATNDCLASRVMYRESANGTSWSTPASVSGGLRPFNYPGAVGAGTKVVVLYNAYSDEVDDEDVLVRLGS